MALLLCFPAARNLAPNRAMHFVFRRVLELFRTVPDIVYALILVWTFGVGPLAGILAIALHTVGAWENCSPRWWRMPRCGPWDAMRASGGNWAQGVRFAILPQVLPNFLSYVLLRFEINVRGATVIGFVGAGGIGQELYSVISFNYYQEIGAIIVLIILTVSAIDLTSETAAHAACDAAGRDMSRWTRRVDIAAMPRARVPACLRPAAADARAAVVGGLLFVAWLVALCVWFDITPARLSRGMSGLFVILRQMVPPSPARSGRTSCKAWQRAWRWRSSAPSSRR